MTIHFAVEVLFWTSLGMVAWCYVGYPLVLGCMARYSGRRHTANRTAPTATDAAKLWSPEEYPFVSLIIAAYKEESIIQQRITNALLMDYPADRYEVLIGVDGNEDATGELVALCDDSRIRLCQYPVRRGKPSVLNDTIELARGEILAFSDANTFWEPDALKKLVQPFSDAAVGGVCGELRLTDPETGENVDGLYWRYENCLKRWEGEVGALLGVNGAIYAIRRDLWDPIPANAIVDDFYIGMRIHLAHRQLRFEPTAIANEESAPSIEAEFHRRARIGAGGFQSLCWLTKLLNPKYGQVALAFWSHKVLRWCCPLFLAVAFLGNLCLLAHPLYQFTMVGQSLFYLSALLGRSVAGRSASRKLLRLSTMFVDMNLALAVGFWRWWSQSQSGAWKRTARSTEPAEPATNSSISASN